MLVIEYWVKERNFILSDDKIPMFPRIFIWLTLLFAAYTLLRMMQGADSNLYNFISWNEFYHEMLAKGEVSQSVTFYIALFFLRYKDVPFRRIVAFTLH